MLPFRYAWRPNAEYLAEFNGSPGEEGGTCMMQAQKDALVADYGNPAQAKSLYPRGTS